jgi:hypothetical protein
VRVALLDANVLYPIALSDLLLDVAGADAYRPLWSADIHGEWVRGRLRDHPSEAPGLERRRAAMDRFFPDAVVTGYQDIIPSLILPDPDDRHVLAAAIHGGANTLVTLNLRDFPADVLGRTPITVVHPEPFLVDLIDHDANAARSAYCWAVKRPERLEAVARMGLTRLAARCRALMVTNDLGLA